METSNIPPIFWRSASASLLALTIGALIHTFRGGSTSLEMAGMKIGLAAIADSTGNLNTELRLRAEELEKAEHVLQLKAKELEERVREVNRNITNPAPQPVKPLVFEAPKLDTTKPTVQPETFIRNQQRIQDLKKELLQVQQTPPKS